MSRWAREQHPAAPNLRWVRGWGDALPFADASFDAVVCKGALDHFDAPEIALKEMARVTRADGRVVLAVANFSSLACLAGDRFDRLAARWLARRPRGRRSYDVPADHFTRYDLALLREQAEPHLGTLEVEGTSLLWGVPAFSRWLDRLPRRYARALLEVADRIARQLPALADVLIVVARPGTARAADAPVPVPGSPSNTSR
jgi:ubiquinone/menaquinone biosynthesis C-methylase UbiE